MSRRLVRTVVSNSRKDADLHHHAIYSLRSLSVVRAAPRTTSQRRATPLHCFSTQTSTSSSTTTVIPPLDGTIQANEHDYENDVDVQKEPWKVLLQMPARAKWRVTDPQLSESVDESLREILEKGGRTNKRLKQIYSEIIDAHTALLKQREKERFQSVYGSNRRKQKEKEAKRRNNVPPVYYGPDQVLASFKFRFFPNYGVAKRVLEECKSLMGPNTWKPKRVLDFGIGVGSASVACLDVWEGIEWIHGIDPSETMRDGAKNMLDAVIQARRVDSTSEEITARVTLAAHLSLESSSLFDVAIMSYTATEFSDSNSIMAAAAMLWEKLEHGGVFIMIEPGTPDGFTSIRTVRNMLLDCCGKDAAEDQCHVIAPCTHSGPCPMERFEKLMNMRKTQMDQAINEEENDEIMDSDDEIDEDDDDDDETDVDDETEDDDETDDDDDDEEEEETDDDVAEEDKVVDVGAGGKDGDEAKSEEKTSALSEGLRTGFCSFVQSMPASQGRNRNEKFSYLVAQKRIKGQCHDFGDLLSDSSLGDLLKRSINSHKENPEESVLQENLKEAQQLATRFLSSDDDDLGMELLRSDEKRKHFSRIIQAPKKRRGHILIECCAAPGQIMRQKVAKSLSKSAPGIFAAARKSRWGGLWPNLKESST